MEHTTTWLRRRRHRGDERSRDPRILTMSFGVVTQCQVNDIASDPVGCDMLSAAFPDWFFKRRYCFQYFLSSSRGETPNSIQPLLSPSPLLVVHTTCVQLQQLSPIKGTDYLLFMFLFSHLDLSPFIGQRWNKDPRILIFELVAVHKMVCPWSPKPI